MRIGMKVLDADETERISQIRLSIRGRSLRGHSFMTSIKKWDF